MPWEFSNAKPIFQQLTDMITADIIRGKYKPGDKLEPVRDLAITAGVNPNTMQRALSEIENSGLIYTKRGDGRYVSEEKEIMDAVVQTYVQKSVTDFISALIALGLTKEQILASVQAQLAI